MESRYSGDHSLYASLSLEVLTPPTRAPGVEALTHWGRMTHICVCKLNIIGSDNGLSPGRRRAIIWNNAGILLIEPLGTNFGHLKRNSYIFILENAFENIVCEVASILSRSQCVKVQLDGHDLCRVITSRRSGYLTSLPKSDVLIPLFTWSEPRSHWTLLHPNPFNQTWPTFCRRKFQLHFLKENLCTFILISMTFCF